MKKFILILSSLFLFWNCDGKTMIKKTTTYNRLAESQSPYLLQHASNPVDWYPWGNEAFEKAKAEDKPIFLSIGYSTCHWCHVMEHESFEDSTVAQLMNENFINIKVDREEMPEVDHLYMSVCQAMTGHGGWPLTIVMTPDREPFFSGTYFPKDSRGKRPGMLQLIPSLANAWNTKQGEIKKTTEKVKTYLQQINTSQPGDEWDEEMMHSALTENSSRFDPDFGGFGRAPKFPSPHNLIFLLRYGKLYGNKTAINMVEKTLHHMRMGGMFDHIGLGFHRYSTDKQWLLPHFEKMLYDQAMLSMAYLEAFQLTGKAEYADVATEIFTYVLRDMTDKEGGFYSAEDADSEGEEGIFYIWTEKEFNEILGEVEGGKLAKIYGFKAVGNFHDEATGQTTGKNIPYYSEEKEILAESVGMNLDEFDAFISKSREKLFAVREKRIQPLKDDKILTDWNGLMIAALSMGGRILNNDIYTEAAEKSAKFLLTKMRDKNGRLMKRSRLGEAGLDPHLDDYAFMVWGLLNLYETTFDTNFLSSAIDLTKIMVEDFSDENGGFFIGSKDAEKLLVRSKDGYDGAMPSGNSTAVMNLFRLTKITGNMQLAEIADKTLKAFTDSAKKSPTAFTAMLTGYMFDMKKSKEVVLVGNLSDPKIDDLMQKLSEYYSPNKVVLFKDISDPNGLIQVAPWIKNHVMMNDLPTFYICEDFSCRRPTNSIELALKYING